LIAGWREINSQLLIAGWLARDALMARFTLVDLLPRFISASLMTCFSL
jgi:hypothetical protein